MHAQDSGRTISIAEALDLGLSRNAALLAAHSRHRASEARVAEARSGYLPQLSVTTGYTRYQEPTIIVPIHEAGVFPPLDDDIFEAAAQLRIPLFDGGRTSAAVRSARALATEAEAAGALTESHLLSELGRIFVQAEQLRDQRRLFTARLDALSERRRELSLLLAEGRVTAGDVALVTSTIEAVRADSLTLASDLRSLAVRLAQLLGEDTPVFPEATSRSRPSPTDADWLTPPGGYADVAGPRVRLAQASLTLAEAHRSQASSQFWPELSALATYIARAGQDRDLIGEWAAGVALRIPLFNGGRRISAARAAAASVQAAEQALRAERHIQQRDMRIVRDRWETAHGRRAHLIDAVAGLSTSVAAAQQLYAAGRISLSDLLTREAELLDLQLAERREAYAVQLAILDHHAISGTLTPDLVQSVTGRIP
ncbi:MAG: TolC family protein [Gemmatimonadales bacterium]